ncbi:efflux RND transporter periplasmic adaptor subunit [Arcticibacter sp.]|jgi:membrane fusion protein (multidrug efflux system)|uniref:efflux RND transporter periplasmic adaptor subunit n=1 Tax=Arcticibacter sp. TaxID=1872630 RepID=UPI0038902476
MNNKLTFASIIFGSALLTACGGSDQSKQAPAAPPAVTVSTYTVQKEEVNGIDSYPGTIVPLNEVDLRAEVNGYITNIFVRDGQQVSKGQKLYEIDRSRYQAVYNQANAQLQIAKANLAKTQKDAERYTRLAEQDAIAKQRVDYAQADLQTAQAQVASAQATLSNAATDLRRSTIVAPFSGKIGISMVRRGALVTAGSTLINTISAPNPMGVDININESDIAYFSQLQQGKATSFNIILPDNSKYTSSGKVLAVDRAVDPQTGTIRVRASFPNANGKLVAGMNCTVQVANKQSGEQITVPYQAVTEQLGEFTVYVVGDSNKVAQRQVKLGIKVNDKIVIQDGLKEGEVIVSTGTQNLREGAVIQTEAPGQPDAAPKQ